MCDVSAVLGLVAASRRLADILPDTVIFDILSCMMWYQLSARLSCVTDCLVSVAGVFLSRQSASNGRSVSRCCPA